VFYTPVFTHPPSITEEKGREDEIEDDFPPLTHVNQEDKGEEDCVRPVECPVCKILSKTLLVTLDLGVDDGRAMRYNYLGWTTEIANTSDQKAHLTERDRQSNSAAEAMKYQSCVYLTPLPSEILLFMLWSDHILNCKFKVANPVRKSCTQGRFGLKSEL
jgi:hypothetical protein